MTIHRFRALRHARHEAMLIRYAVVLQDASVFSIDAAARRADEARSA